ncbi:hypothetical protein PsYK624_068790 [Phanerochaete sordida]|uniref:F-box domain-containing protein n=1 Tax=Phanerochaete sordida TaxID=48140 RepID=A0A9P3GBA3_9APHY|nr:hypothetical protein PsYK624_068790 [Phanerochaete sordida]
MPSQTSLPQELVDMSVDHLHDDIPALKHCSLVCRDWVPGASHHLFAVFEWPPRSIGPGDIGTEGEECFRQLVDILSAAPRIAHAVHELLLHSRNSLSIFLTPRTMVSLVDLLPNLRELSSLGCKLRPDSHQAADSAHTRTIQSLEFIGASIFDHLPHFLRPFRRIQTLAIRGYNRVSPHDHNVSDAPPVFSGSLAVENIELERCCFSCEMLSDLNGLVNFAAVRRLELESPPTGDAAPFIRAMHGLELLTYQISPTDVRPDLGLAHLPAVQIACYLRPSTSSPGGDSGWFSLMRHLELFVGPHMRELGVKLLFTRDVATVSDADLESWLSGLDWGQLARHAERCPALTTLSIGLGRALSAYFTMSPGRYHRIVRAVAEEKLPKTLMDKVKI